MRAGELVREVRREHRDRLTISKVCMRMQHGPSRSGWQGSPSQCALPRWRVDQQARCWNLLFRVENGAPEACLTPGADIWKDDNDWLQHVEG